MDNKRTICGCVKSYYQTIIVCHGPPPGYDEADNNKLVETVEPASKKRES
jgi:hypothetical protein